MKIVVTGGLGFIGKTLTKQLLAEHENEIVIIDTLSEQVHGANPDYDDLLSQPNVSFVKGDISDKSLLQEHLCEVDVLYHLAAETGTGQSMYEIDRYYQTNVQGTARVLEQIVQNTEKPKQVILTSSRSVYGEGAYVSSRDADSMHSQRYYPGSRSVDAMDGGFFEFLEDGVQLVPVATKETDPAQPGSLYAASKLAQEQMCQITCEAHNIKFTSLRLQNVYGPGQSLKNPYTGIISIFINILRQNGQINVFEDGLETRDFVFIEDVATSLNRARFISENSAVINVGSGIPASVLQLVALLEEKMAKPNSHYISGNFRPGDIRHNFADCSLMQSKLGFETALGLSEGLDRTIDWAMTQPIEEDLSKKANEELKRALLDG